MPVVTTIITDTQYHYAAIAQNPWTLATTTTFANIDIQKPSQIVFKLVFPNTLMWNSGDKLYMHIITTQWTNNSNFVVYNIMEFERIHILYF